MLTFGLKSWSRGQVSQAASAVCSGGESTVIGSSDLSGLNIFSGHTQGNQRECSFPFGGSPLIVELMCLRGAITPLRQQHVAHRQCADMILVTAAEKPERKPARVNPTPPAKSVV